MTVDLWCLVALALWGFGLVSVESIAKTRVAGRAWNLGNRETSPPFPAWIDRMTRAIANHKENFPLFLTAVLVVAVVGRANHLTATAAMVYLGARVAHGLLYVGGVKGFRSAAHVISVVAFLVILGCLVV